jgi:hypothetical protein
MGTPLPQVVAAFTGQGERSDSGGLGPASREASNTKEASET